MAQHKLIAKLRSDAAIIFQSGIDAADPYLAVKKCLHSVDNQLQISLDRNSSDNRRSGAWHKIHLIAFGKAACTMAKAAQEVIPVHLLTEPGLAVCNYENIAAIEHIDVIGAGHPLPDMAGFSAALRIAEIAQQAEAGELVLVLISGGGSALIPYPANGISLADKIATTDLLLASGATINEVNCVRKHLSCLKGGGLAKMAAPADIHALVLSDVLGDELSVIASGPTFADETTFSDAIKVVTENQLWNKVPLSVQNHLQQGEQGIVSETPKADDGIFKHTAYTLIGSNALSVNAVMQSAGTLNYQAHLYSDQLNGEAKDVTEELLQYAQALLSEGINKPYAIVAGGETTVTLQGMGLGGRNQEMALAFALAAEKHTLAADWVFLSAGTDGRDGPTDAAGGIVDTQSITRMHDADIKAEQYLANNDAYHALQKSKDLLITGATGTNVADLQILLIQPNTNKSQSGDHNV